MGRVDLFGWFDFQKTAVSYNLHITLRCIDSIKQSFERHPFYWQATLEKSEYYSESVRSSIS
jgi:hypothetical protein